MTHALNNSIESLPWALQIRRIFIILTTATAASKLVDRCTCRHWQRTDGYGYVVDFLTSSSKSHIGMAMWRNTSHSTAVGCSCDGNDGFSQTSQQLNSTPEAPSYMAPVFSHFNSRNNYQW